MRERLAELEHEQWMEWSKSIGSFLTEWKKMIKKGDAHDVLEEIDFKLRKWKKNWKPYSGLNDDEKDKDRIWADKVMKIYNFDDFLEVDNDGHN